MATGRLKPIIFGGVVLVALILIIGLVVHRTSVGQRICENGNELYYEDPVTQNGTCYRSGAQGPCGENMVVTIDPKNSSVGICGCDVANNERVMVYHPDTNQCYFIFKQAFCEDGKWLTVIKDNTKTPPTPKPICDLRLCDVPQAPGEMVPLADGRCVELGKTDPTTCNDSQTVRFHKGKIYPSCTYLKTSIGSIGVPPSECPGGFLTTDLGHCQPDFDFD